MLSNISRFLIQQWQLHPLRAILIIALSARMLAVFFAPGYMMHDDHFLTIEPSASWADGKNFNHWLPGIGNTNEHPEPISFFYLGFLYVFFSIFNVLGIDAPETQMLLIRAIHALYSLLTVYFGFKITRHIGTLKDAKMVGLLLACIAIMPNFSVRNLVEMVCMPPLLGGMWLLIRYIPLRDFKLGPIQLQGLEQQQPSSAPWIKIALAAFIMGLAVGVRFQTGLFVAVVGGILWLQHSFRALIIFGITSFAAFFLTQIDDVLLWGGQPFQHLQGYFAYNKKNALNYPGSPLAYLSFISVFILPPVSIFLTIGFFRNLRKLAIIVLPTLAFLIFHILYPNKQERFILPVLPFFVIAGVMGWNHLAERRNFGRWQTISLNIFWIINTIAMLTLCFTYSKRSRVEAMTYLYERGDCNNFILEFTHSPTGAMMPQFYSNRWTTYYYFKQGDPMEGVMRNFEHEATETANEIMPRTLPNYILFYDDNQLDQRVARMRNHYPQLTFCTTIESGWFDEMLHALNPKNTLEKIHIYTIGSPAAPIFP
jgi:hypothetical protein